MATGIFIVHFTYGQCVGKWFQVLWHCWQGIKHASSLQKISFLADNSSTAQYKSTRLQLWLNKIQHNTDIVTYSLQCFDSFSALTLLVGRQEGHPGKWPLKWREREWHSDLANMMWKFNRQINGSDPGVGGQFVCLFAWGLTALSAQIGYIAP